MGKNIKALIDETKYYEKKYFEKNKDRVIDLAEVNKSKPIKRWCKFDYKTKTLSIELNDGQPIALTLRKHKEKISGQTILFEVGYELWEENNPNFNLQIVLEKCSQKIRQYGIVAEATNYWFKNTRANLRTTIESSQVRDFVRAFDAENPRSGKYHFSIKLLP